MVIDSNNEGIIEKKNFLNLKITKKYFLPFRCNNNSIIENAQVPVNFPALTN